MADIAKKKKEQEADQFTVYLTPKERDTKPWYADRGLRRYEDMEEGEQADERRARDRCVHAVHPSCKRFPMRAQASFHMTADVPSFCSRANVD